MKNGEAIGQAPRQQNRDNATIPSCGAIDSEARGAPAIMFLVASGAEEEVATDVSFQ